MRAVTTSPYRRKDKDERTAEANPQLEHRHFAVIAAVIKDMPPAIRYKTAFHFANQFSYKRVNKKFDRARFINACGGVPDDPTLL